MSQAEQITDAIVYHGEGPVWAQERGELWFVDQLAGDVVSYADGAPATRLHVGEVAAALRPRTGGGMVVAIERGFILIDDDGMVTPLPSLWTDPAIRMNEGGCDPQGRFYCGSMAYDFSPGAGRLYCLDVDHSTSTVLDSVTISNGLAWSPDHALAYYIDTPTQRIDVFDYDPATGLSGRRPFVTIDKGDGGPDGLTVDADGHVWVALWGGAAVRRYRPDGRLDGVVQLPASQVTACTFGGADLDELFITTSRENLPDDAEPEAGALYRFRPGVRGLPVLPYAG